jgi:hypothetical protein
MIFISINNKKEKIMSKEENSNFETRIENDAEINPTIVPESNPESIIQPAESPKDKKRYDFKNVAAGLAGIVIGSVATSFVVPEDIPENPAAQNNAPLRNPPLSEDFNGEEIPHANSVTDSMSFNEAFAAARHEVGAGGVFQWHGGVYGTYYRDEWNSFSPEYRNAFSNYPYVQNDSHANTTPEVQDTTSVPLTDENTETVAEEHSSSPSHSDVPVGDVELLSDVQYMVVDGRTVAVVPGVIDGIEVLMVDADNNADFDVILVDNGTEQPDVYDISGAGFTQSNVHQFARTADSSDTEYLVANDMPDYSNNNDVGELV